MKTPFVWYKLGKKSDIFLLCQQFIFYNNMRKGEYLQIDETKKKCNKNKLCWKKFEFCYFVTNGKTIMTLNYHKKYIWKK